MATPFTLAKEATTGFSDGSHYDKYRPSYTPEAVDKLLMHLKVAGVKNAKIIDLACGTGKFTEVLAARPEDYEIIAIEPHAGMRETLEEKNLGPRVRILDGDAGHMPVEDGWADALIAAQAFHWFATEESLREIHRILTPGSTFGLIWNIEDYNGAKEWVSATSWEKKLKDIVASMEDGKPRFRHLKWKEIFDKQVDTTPLQTLKDTFMHNMPEFSLPLGEETLKWTVWLSDEAVWNRYSTLSQVANSGPKKEGIRKEVFKALKSEDTVRNEKGEVAVHGITYLAWTSRV